MKELMFTKMHGAGNDYIFLNCLSSTPENLCSLSVRLADRRKGVGSDGLVAILPSDTADFKMRIFNADGSEALMCGNAARCVGKYVYEKGLTNESELALETLSGVKYLKLQIKDGIVNTVTVDMGIPSFDPERIPVIAKSAKNIIVAVNGTDYTLTAVSIGNPHGVVFCEDVDLIDLPKIGGYLENCAIFPQRANIEFVKVINSSELAMRVWERGSGETLACGTGACAALVVAAYCGMTERTATVHLPGGDLYIDWRENNHIYMTGSAEYSFEGKMRIEE